MPNLLVSFKSIRAQTRQLDSKSDTGVDENDQVVREMSNLFRLLFVLCLAAEIVVAGYLTYEVLRYNEENTFKHSFYNMADESLDIAVGAIERTKMVTRALSASFAGSFPNASHQWPEVALPGFVQIASYLQDITPGDMIFYSPLLYPDEVSSFETFAYDHFAEIPDYLPGAGHHSFGTGIYKFGDNGKTESDTSGATEWGGSNTILTPVFQASNASSAFVSTALMYNSYSNEVFGSLIDFIINCSNIRAAEMKLGYGAGRECHSMSGFVDKSSFEFFDNDTEIQSLMFNPIYLRGSSDHFDVLRGFTASTITWRDFFANLQLKERKDVDFEIKTADEIYTYSVADTKVVFRGPREFHSKELEKYSKSRVIFLNSANELGHTMYTLTVYPSLSFYKQYVTRTPAIATAAVVIIILLTCCVFFGYDRVMRREVDLKDEMLEVRRQFLRYICHELRSPLNAIALGMEVLLELMKREDVSKNKDYKHNEEKVAAALLLSSSSASNLDLGAEILQNCNLATSVLDDLINFDLVQANQLSMKFAPVDIWGLLTKIFNSFTPSAKIHRINLVNHFNISEMGLTATDQALLNHCRVYGDSTRLEQVLHAVMAHAFKFTSQGGNITLSACWIPPVEARKTTQTELESPSRYRAVPEHASNKDGELFASLVSFDIENPLPDQARQGFIEIKVQDDGAGIDPKKIDSIFSEDREFNITYLQSNVFEGLGIFMSRRVVNMHGGQISAQSLGIGLGSTVCITLPLFCAEESISADLCYDHTSECSHDDENTSCNLRIALSEKSSDDLVLQPKRILVVDDVPSCRKIMIRLLVLKGNHLCEEASNGKEAIEKYVESKGAYETILMDNEMPEMNGPDAAKELRKLGCECPIIGVTGNVLPADVEYFLEHGANAVLPKPFNYAELEFIWKRRDEYKFSETRARRNSAIRVKMTRTPTEDYVRVPVKSTVVQKGDINC